MRTVHIENLSEVTHRELTLGRLYADTEMHDARQRLNKRRMQTLSHKLNKKRKSRDMFARLRRVSHEFKKQLTVSSEVLRRHPVGGFLDLIFKNEHAEVVDDVGNTKLPSAANTASLLLSENKQFCRVKPQRKPVKRYAIFELSAGTYQNPRRVDHRDFLDSARAEIHIIEMLKVQPDATLIILPIFTTEKINR